MDLDERYALLRAQFGDLNEWQALELRHCCELQHLASAARQALLEGTSGVTIADLSKLEDEARTALSDLKLPPAARKDAVNKLEVVFIKAAPPLDRLTPAQVAQIDSGLRTRAEIAESLLEGYRNRPTEAAGAPNGSEGPRQRAAWRRTRSVGRVPSVRRRR
jgi:hypothetical protein